MNTERESIVFGCGCKALPLVEGWHLERCPLHAAAPTLLEACKEAAERLRRTAEKTEQFICASDPLPPALELMVLGVYRVISAAIAEAERTGG